MKRAFIVGSLMLVSVAVVFGSVVLKEKNNVGNEAYSFKKARSQLFRLFETDGSVAASTFVRMLAEQSDPGTTHALEHELGKELYQREGLKGIRQCEETLFGCFHGFVGTAVAQNDIGIVPSLEKNCGSTRAGLSCIHGIGHGILEREGYTDEGLIRALSDCDTLSTLDVRKGCFQGVFMEFYTPTMSTDGEPTIRSFHDDDPLLPCTEMSERYQASCYFELPGYWMATIGDKFEQMGNFCYRIGNIDHQIQCFRGIGQIATGVTRFVPDALVSLCRSMPIQDAVTACTISAAIQFALKKDINSARVLCTSLPSGVHQQCTEEFEASYE